jgi:hypothetical protein
MKLNELLLVLQQRTGSDKGRKTKECIWKTFLTLISEYSYLALRSMAIH